MPSVDEYDAPAPAPAVKAAPAVAPSGDKSDLSEYTIPPSGSAGSTASADAEKEPNWGTMPVSEIAKRGAQTFIPAAVVGAGNMAQGAAQAVAHTVETGELPGKGLVEAGDAWLNRKLSGYAPETMKVINKAIGYTPPTDENYTKTVEPGTEAVEDLKSRWGSRAAIAKGFGTNTPAMLLDAATFIDPALRLGKGASALTAGKSAARLGEKATAADLGQAVHGAASDALAAKDAAYKQAFGHTAVFDPAAAQPIMGEVQANLAKVPNFPGLNRLDKHPHLADAKVAYDHLNDSLRNIDPHDFTMPNMENIRRDLQQKAMETESGPARYMIGQMIDGIDSGISKVATKPGMYAGDGAAVASDMAKARKLNVDWIKQFGSEAPSSFKPTMGVLPKDLATADDSHFHAAGTGLGNALMNEGKGGVLYNHLKQFVPKETLDNYLREPMLAGKSADVTKRLNTPIAQNVFGSELDRAKKLAATQDTSTLMGKAAPVLKWGARTAAPAAGHFLFPGFGGILGGSAAEFALEKMLPKYGAGRAPLYERFVGESTPPLTKIEAAKRAVNPLTWAKPSTYTPLLNPAAYKEAALPLTGAGAIGHRAAEAPHTAAAVTSTAPTESDPLAGMSYGYDPTGQNRYASGGAVKGHQHLVDRLFAAHERAKREEKAHTAGILHQPDEAVAKALHVAQAAI
jgi:hypothetical protein